MAQRQPRKAENYPDPPSGLLPAPPHFGNWVSGVSLAGKKPARSSAGVLSKIRVMKSRSGAPPALPQFRPHIPPHLHSLPQGVDCGGESRRFLAGQGDKPHWERLGEFTVASRASALRLSSRSNPAAGPAAVASLIMLPVAFLMARRMLQWRVEGGVV
jgi:hypothetical protein